VVGIDNEVKNINLVMAPLKWRNCQRQNCFYIFTYAVIMVILLLKPRKDYNNNHEKQYKKCSSRNHSVKNRSQRQPWHNSQHPR